MPTPKAKRQPVPPAPPQVQASPPVRVEVRFAGRVRFSDVVYSPTFDIGEGTVSFTADLAPTMIDRPVLAPQRFDPASEDIIQTVHSGRREVVAPTPKES